MEKTLKNMDKIRNILNTNPVCQEQMENLRQIAVKNNWTEEQWSEMKQRLLGTLFLQMCEKIDGMKDDLASDIYNELRNAE